MITGPAHYNPTDDCKSIVSWVPESCTANFASASKRIHEPPPIVTVRSSCHQAVPATNPICVLYRIFLLPVHMTYMSHTLRHKVNCEGKQMYRLRVTKSTYYTKHHYYTACYTTSSVKCQHFRKNQSQPDTEGSSILVILISFCSTQGYTTKSTRPQYTR